MIFTKRTRTRTTPIAQRILLPLNTSPLTLDLPLSLTLLRLSNTLISTRSHRIDAFDLALTPLLVAHDLIVVRGDDVRAVDPRNSRAWRKHQQAHKARCREENAVCDWCGKAIDYDLPPSHGRAFSSDHIVELQYGGHILGELAPFHRDCNSRKGNGGVKPALQVRSSRAW